MSEVAQIISSLGFPIVALQRLIDKLDKGD